MDVESEEDSIRHLLPAVLLGGTIWSASSSYRPRTPMTIVSTAVKVSWLVVVYDLNWYGYGITGDWKLTIDIYCIICIRGTVYYLSYTMGPTLVDVIVMSATAMYQRTILRLTSNVLRNMLGRWYHKLLLTWQCSNNCRCSASCLFCHGHVACFAFQSAAHTAGTYAWSFRGFKLLRSTVIATHRTWIDMLFPPSWRSSWSM